MKNKVFAIIAMVILVVCTTIGYFIEVPVADVIAIAGAFFSATMVFLNVLKKIKDDKKVSWKQYVVIFGAVLAGVLCCFGGVSENIISSVCGAVVALITLIVGVLAFKK